MSWAALLTYLLLLGGTPVGELDGWVQATNGVIAMGLIFLWLRRAPGEADRLDAAIIVALVIFLASATISLVPRQSFAAAIQVTALVAGFHLARRGLVGELRGQVHALFGWICLLVVGSTLAAWVATWIGWLQAAGWSTAPPLSIWLPPGVFDNRHYVGTLVLLLAPGLWGETFRRRRPLVALAGTVGAAGVLLMDASRTLVTAAIVASLVVAAMHASAITKRLRGRLLALVIASGTVLVIGAVSMSPLILERITNLPKLMARFGFFGNAIDVWLDHPLAGVGPGVYPFSYFLNDYFANVNYAPRHPDNAVAQLLVEAGLLGITAATLVLIAIASAARRRWQRNPAATWALAAFLLACIGTNPTDFLFLLVPTLIWTAMLVPASEAPVSAPSRPRQSRWWSRAVGLVAVPVAAAVLATSIGSVAYQLAGDRYRAGDEMGAARELDVAVAFDPGQALYWRERGSLLLARGAWREGRISLEHALRLVPWDPGAMRGLALARLAAGDPRAGLASALAVSGIQPHSAASDIVVAVAALQSGALDISKTAISHALLEAPYLGFVPWSGTVLSEFDVTLALRGAAQSATDYAPGEFGINRVLVVLMAGGADASAPAFGETYSSLALAAVADCDERAAEQAIQLADSVEREYGFFWIASAIVSQAFPQLGVMGPAPAARFIGLPRSPGPDTSSVLADGVDDVLRYRRTSLDISTPTTAMPNASRGLWLVTNDPTRTMSALTSWPRKC